MNERQPVLIKGAIAGLPKNAEIICAMDNDDTGRKLAAMVEDCFQAVSRPDLCFRLDLPSQENADWNAVLQTTPLPPRSGGRASWTVTKGLGRSEVLGRP